MHRGWLDHPIFGGSRREPYCRRSAWIWLIDHALYEPATVVIAGKPIALQRGQLSYSYRYLAETWGWSEARVRRYCVAVASVKMIVCDTDAGQAVITICNYDKYQNFERVGDAANGASVTQHRRSIDANKKEGEVSKEEIPNGILSGNGSGRLPDVPAEMTKIWNEECGTISRANKPNASRRGRCARAWRHEFGGSADQWRAYCRTVAASPHLRGENDREWRADLDWVLKPENISKIQEGRYERRSSVSAAYAGPDAPAPSPEELFGPEYGRKMGLPH